MLKRDRGGHIMWFGRIIYCWFCGVYTADISLKF